MGITFAKVELSNPRRSRARPRELEFLIDTGAIFSVVPGSVLRTLGIRKLEREEFTLADGTKRFYDVGEAFFRLGSKAATSKVIFAPEGATPLLGALTLESLGLMVNPVTREVSPMRLILASGDHGRDLAQVHGKEFPCSAETASLAWSSAGEVIAPGSALRGAPRTTGGPP